MNSWQFDDGPINVGIDIGWSDKKKSCALAVEGLSVPNDARDWKTYCGSGRRVVVGLFRYVELLTAVEDLIRLLGPRRERTTIVVDGPVGPNGLANQNRCVDTAFGRGAFHGRMQPSPVATGTGPRYAAVTDQLVKTLYAAAGLPYRPAWWDGRHMRGFTCCETHPTVGLALLLPPQDPKTLPTRRSPRKMAVNSPAFTKKEAPFVRAKSDWYWQLGAGTWVAKEVLSCVTVARELHHERVAGLYCLAVANRLAVHREDTSAAVAVGSVDGVYVLPAVVDRAWEKALIDQVGIHAGELLPRDQSAYLIAPGPVPFEVAGSAVEQEHPVPDDTDNAERDDSAILILNDNGGIWERQNDWLTGLEPPVCVKCVDGDEETVRLEKAGGAGQWMASDKENKPRQLAARRGFNEPHLSKSRAWAVPVVLVDCEGTS